MPEEDGEMLYSVPMVYLCLTFLFSAIPKLLPFRSFVELVQAYGILSPPYDGIFTHLLPFLECRTFPFRETFV